MHKKILIFIAMVAFSASSFAATGKGYKIIGEEYHSASNFNFHVEEVPQGTAAAQKKSMNNGRTVTSVPSESGHVNTSISVDGYHDISIVNTSDKTQVYEYTISLDCEALHSYYTRHIQVDPRGYYSGSEHSMGTVQKSYTGTYRISGETRLTGESSDLSRDFGSLYIYK